MSILQKLATSLNRRDEAPNQDLAKEIVSSQDQNALKELVENLYHKNKDIQSDCIKVLYEVAALTPSLVAPFANDFVALLDHKNNRLQWGAMTVLNVITKENPQIIHSALAKVIAVADKGSVITNDQYVGILIKLCAMEAYHPDAFSLLLERLMSSPTNQLPMYAENALPVITRKSKAVFIETLSARLGEIDKDSKRIRVEKVIKKLQKL